MPLPVISLGLGGVVMKLIGGGILALALTIGGCKIKGLLNAKRDLDVCQHEKKQLAQELFDLKKNFQVAVKEAAGKCEEGQKLDQMKKEYKLNARTCRKLLKKQALDIARQSGKLLK